MNTQAPIQPGDDESPEDENLDIFNLGFTRPDAPQHGSQVDPSDLSRPPENEGHVSTPQPDATADPAPNAEAPTSSSVPAKPVLDQAKLGDGVAWICVSKKS